jgi:hypothetical protein
VAACHPLRKFGSEFSMPSTDINSISIGMRLAMYSAIAPRLTARAAICYRKKAT